MSDKRWYQVRWNAERTDNISAADLKGAYTIAWHALGDASPAGIPADSDHLTIEDMVTGRQYRVSAEYLEYDLEDGWNELARRLENLEGDIGRRLIEEGTRI